MNGPCSLHSPEYIKDAARVAEAIVEDPIGGVPLTLRATRKTVFQRYCEDLAVYGELDVLYAGTEDIQETAGHCAAMILADQCPMYVVAEQIKAEHPRIITREVLARFPDKYRLVS